MNYAIESMDMSDFCRLYSDKYKKNYKVENPGTENRCSGITELLMTYPIPDLPDPEAWKASEGPFRKAGDYFSSHHSWILTS